MIDFTGRPPLPLRLRRTFVRTTPVDLQEVILWPPGQSIFDLETTPNDISLATRNLLQLSPDTP